MPETTRTTTPRPTRKSADFTGRQAEEQRRLAADKARDKAEAEAAARAIKDDADENAVFDPYDDTQIEGLSARQEVSVNSHVTEIVDTGSVDMASGTVVVRVAEDIPNMTYGYGVDLSFKGGKAYEVSVHVADRLRKLNMLY